MENRETPLCIESGSIIDMPIMALMIQVKFASRFLQCPNPDSTHIHHEFVRLKKPYVKNHGGVSVDMKFQNVDPHGAQPLAVELNLIILQLMTEFLGRFPAMNDAQCLCALGTDRYTEQ